jgi:hypothetical protein
MTCNNDCDQGRTCTCTPQQELFWQVMKNIVTLAVIIGVIATLCFSFGYFLYRN